jgi:beta-glucosidase
MSDIPEAEVARRVETILAGMSIEEKIGQLTQIAGAPFFPGPEPEEVIRKGGAGSVLWLNDTQKFNALQKIAVEESPSKIPLLFALDVIHGYRTIFPVPLAMASSWDPSVAERAQAVAAKEARAAGLHWTFGPMLDIARDARWGRIVEGAGEDPCPGCGHGGCPGARLPGAVSRRARPCSGLRQTLRRVRRGGWRARLRSGLPARIPLAQRLLPALPGRREGRRGDVHERLHGPQRCTREREPLPVARRSARRVGTSRASSSAMRWPSETSSSGLRARRSRRGFRALSAGINMDMASNTSADHLAGLVEDGTLNWPTSTRPCGPFWPSRCAWGFSSSPTPTSRSWRRCCASPSTGRKRCLPRSGRWCCCETKAGCCRWRRP